MPDQEPAHQADDCEQHCGDRAEGPELDLLGHEHSSGEGERRRVPGNGDGQEGEAPSPTIAAVAAVQPSAQAIQPFLESPAYGSRGNALGVGDRDRAQPFVVMEQNRAAVGLGQSDNELRENTLRLRALEHHLRRWDGAGFGGTRFLAPSPAPIIPGLPAGEIAQNLGEPGSGWTGRVRWRPQGRDPGILHQVLRVLAAAYEVGGQPAQPVGMHHEVLHAGG